MIGHVLWVLKQNTRDKHSVYQPSEVAANLLQGTLECGTLGHSLHTETKQTKQNKKWARNSKYGNVTLLLIIYLNCISK